MAGHLERWSSPFTRVEMCRLWTYSDGALTVKGYRLPDGTAGAGSWMLVDQVTGNVQGVVPPGEFSRRFRPVDLFADVPGLPTYLATVTAPDGTALVDLVLDRNPFMLANGPRRVPRPHVLNNGRASGSSPQPGSANHLDQATIAHQAGHKTATKRTGWGGHPAAPRRTSRPWNAAQAYSESKLHVTALALTIARVWPDVLSNAVNPGWVPTKMGGPEATGDLRTGYLTQTWLAVSNDGAATVSGGYWYHRQRQASAAQAGDQAFQDQLMDQLAALTGVALFSVAVGRIGR